MSQRFRQAEMTPVYGFFHHLSCVVYDALFRGEVNGLENLPKSGGFLIASNHASHLDPPLVGAHITQQVCFFARKTLWKPGFASWWLDAVGTIPVDRDGGSDVQAIKRVLRAIAQDKVIILFPEGTRSPDGRLQTAKAGVGMMACRTGVPVPACRCTMQPMLAEAIIPAPPSSRQSSLFVRRRSDSSGCRIEYVPAEPQHRWASRTGASS